MDSRETALENIINMNSMCSGRNYEELKIKG